MSRSRVFPPTRAMRVFILVLAIGSAGAVAEEWRLIKPTNSGVPGESVLGARFAPDGKLWVSARWPFFQEGGIGIYDFGSDSWETYANWDSPVPSQYINDVEWAADGTVWMASGAITGPGGLVHKDGDKWTIYDSTNSPLIHNIIRTIDLDAEGHVWMIASGTQESESALYEFDGTSWRSWQVPEIPFDEPWDRLVGLLVASDGHVFVTNSVLNGIAEFDGTTWTLHGENVTRFGGLMEDAEGNIWTAGGVGGGNWFYKFNRSTGTFTTYNSTNTPLTSTTPTLISQDREGRVYLGNWFGQIARTDNFGESWSMFTVQNNRVYSLAQQENGDFWVVTPGAVRHLDENGTWLKAFNTYNTGIPDMFIDDLKRAPDGNMLFISGEAGYSKYDGTRWNNLGSHNPNEPWPVLADGADSVYVDSTGATWIGTNGALRVEGEVQQLWDWRNSNMGVISGQALGEDRNGHIWLGTGYTAVYEFDGATWAHRPIFGGSLADNEVMAIEQDSTGDMWLATVSGIHRYDGATWTHWSWINYPTIFDRGGIVSMAIAPDDTIWLGMGDGLVRFDPVTDSFDIYDENNSPLPAKTVQGIAFRDDGVMALSVHTFQSTTPFPHGLVIVDGPIEDSQSWTVHTFQNSPMRHYQLGDVEFDGAGNVWLSTISEGVAVLLIGNNGLLGDMNCDGLVSVSDIGPFVTALTDPAGYAALFLECDINNGDINTDGLVSVGDIGAFVALLTK